VGPHSPCFYLFLACQYVLHCVCSGLTVDCFNKDYHYHHHHPDIVASPRFVRQSADVYLAVDEGPVDRALLDSRQQSATNARSVHRSRTLNVCTCPSQSTTNRPQSSIVALNVDLTAGVTVKRLLHKKSARKEIITELICLPITIISPAP